VRLVHTVRRRRSRGVLIIALVVGLGLSRSGAATPYVCGVARRDLQRIDWAVQLYVLAEGHLPPEETWSVALHEQGLLQSPDIPIDPWGHPIVFEWQGDSYELMTLGYDGMRDTADDQIRADDWADTGVCRVPRRSWCSA
jgi:hypothetical protein